MISRSKQQQTGIYSVWLLISVALLYSSCLATKRQFGQSTIKSSSDTAFTRQEIAAVRSQGNNSFEPGMYTRDSIEIRYRLHKPRGNGNAAAKYPLVVVFHGSGAIGTDNTSQLGMLSKLFAVPEIQEDYPAFILAPQFPTRSSDYIQDSNRHILVSSPRACLQAVLLLIDSLKDCMGIDRHRIYVVGYSMGGSTVINSLSARPDLFAAGVSIAGIPQFARLEQISAIPIWLIHGLDDTENTIASDEQFYKELKKHKKIRFWKLEGTRHDNVLLHERVLGKALPDWLFKQRKL